MRYGYWMPVFGGWLRNVDNENMEPTWEYVKKLAIRSEVIGFDLSLIAELNRNDIKAYRGALPRRLVDSRRPRRRHLPPGIDDRRPPYLPQPGPAGQTGGQYRSYQQRQTFSECRLLLVARMKPPSMAWASNSTTTAMPGQAEWLAVTQWRLERERLPASREILPGRQ